MGFVFFYRIFVIIFLVIKSAPVHSQYLINRTVQDEKLVVSTLDLIYNFQFDEAQKQIVDVKKKFPNHPIYHFLMAMKYYWEMVPMSIDNPKYKEYEHHLLKTIETSDFLMNQKGHKQEATFFKMAANSSLIVVYLKAKDYGKAVAEARKTYTFMKDGFEWGDKYPDFNFSSGLYYFYAEQYPETHPIIQPVMWFFTKGDKDLGVSLLKKSAEKSVFSKTESDFFLAHVQLKYFNAPNEALKYTSKLVERYPNNLFYLARHTEALVLSKHYTEARPVCDKLMKSPTDYFQISGQLFTGLIDLASNNLLAAKKHFENVEKIALSSKKQTSDYLTFAYLGLGKVYEKENNEKKTAFYFDKVEEMGEYKIHILEVQAYKNRKKAKHKK